MRRSGALGDRSQSVRDCRCSIASMIGPKPSVGDLHEIGNKPNRKRFGRLLKIGLDLVEQLAKRDE